MIASCIYFLSFNIKRSFLKTTPTNFTLSLFNTFIQHIRNPIDVTCLGFLFPTPYFQLLFFSIISAGKFFLHIIYIICIIVYVISL